MGLWVHLPICLWACMCVRGKTQRAPWVCVYPSAKRQAGFLGPTAGGASILEGFTWWLGLGTSKGWGGKGGSRNPLSPTPHP